MPNMARPGLLHCHASALRDKPFRICQPGHELVKAPTPAGLPVPPGSCRFLPICLDPRLKIAELKCMFRMLQAIGFHKCRSKWIPRLGNKRRTETTEHLERADVERLWTQMTGDGESQ